MRDAKSFGQIEDESVNSFIEKYIYPKFDQKINPVIIYENLVKQENINHKELEKKLKELNFKLTRIEIGVDNALEIRV